jgi:copper resistance protein C
VTVTTWVAPTQISCSGGRTPRFASHIRVGIGFLLTMAAIFAVAIPAFAHTMLVSSDPADGAVLTSPPGAVTLVFDGIIQSDFAQVVVLDADGAHQERGEPQVDGATVSQPLSTLPEGLFNVSYRVVAGDGHPVTGTLSFTVAASPESAAAQPSDTSPATHQPTVGTDAAAPSDNGTSRWAMVSTGVLFLAALSTGLVAVGLRRARRADNGRAHMSTSEDASEER